MKAVDLLIDSLLPEELQGTVKDMDSKSLDILMSAIATKYPDKYEAISKGIADAGRNASYLQGETITLNDMRTPFDKSSILAAMDKELDRVRQANPETFPKTRVKVWEKYNDIMQNMTSQSAREKNNNLAYSVVSGARGKPAQLKAMLATPGYYADYKGDTIPLFVRNSFGQGLRPAEFLAGTYGARTSVLSTKNSTARGGDFAKQLGQSAASTIVTMLDCGVKNGIDLELEDSSMRGRVLARSTAGVPAGTILDKHALGQLRRSKSDTAVVRSPLTCQAREGVCAKCVGQFHNNKLPSVGDAVGITAAQSISEPVTQGALNCLAENTEVLMGDFSYKKIQDVRVGDMVMGADVEAHLFPVKVTHTWDQGLQPVQTYGYKLGQTKDIREVVCTEEHKILQITTYSNAKEGKFNFTPRILKAGRPAGLPSAVLPSGFKEGVGIEEDFATLYGFHLGDGIRLSPECLQASVCVSCACSETAADLKTEMAKLGLTMKKRKRSHDWAVSDLQKGTSLVDAKGQFEKGFHNRYKLLLQSLGALHECYHNKVIAPVVWEWDNKSIAKMIAGFVSADGSVYRVKELTPGVSFGSTALSMLEELKRLLELRFGIYSTQLTRTSLASKSETRKHDGWQFCITRRDQLKKFNELIAPFIPGPKREKLRQYLEEAPKSHYETSTFYKGRRIYAEPKGMTQCYDITVDHKDHLFVLRNGLIVSNSKHTGGMASGKREYSGFDVINQLVQSPEVFPDRATVAHEAGRVESITEAPQGGFYIKLNGKDLYVPAGYDVTAKVGDKVEAGDQLSDGIVDPEDIMKLRGLGSGRRYYAERLNKALTDSGMAVDRRNVELVSRGAFDHVKIQDDEGMPGYLPDDVVSYNKLTSHAAPAKDAKGMRPSQAVGKFLATPALHYSIGTKITPRMADRLEKSHYDSIYTSDREPSFTPQSVRLRTAAHSNPDWLASMATSYLKTQLEHAAIRGDDTNVNSNVHFGPRLARGTEFGKDVATTGKF